jgi:hypothetical protein
MKMSFIRWTITLFALVLPCFSAVAQLPTPTPTPAELPNPPYAIVTYPSANPATQSQSVTTSCLNGIFELVGLQPDQVVQVVVQYPTNQALQVVNLEALDGGIILPPTVGPVNPPRGPLTVPVQPVSLSLVISTDGTVVFTLQATHNLGRNQIRLRQGSQELGLQFWVLDPQNPQNNPPAITPDNPN